MVGFSLAAGLTVETAMGTCLLRSVPAGAGQRQVPKARAIPRVARPQVPVSSIHTGPTSGQMDNKHPRPPRKYWPCGDERRQRSRPESLERRRGELEANPGFLAQDEAAAFDPTRLTADRPPPRHPPPHHSLPSLPH